MTIHTVLYTFLSSLIALFPVLNPLTSALLVNGYLHDLDFEQRKAAARTIFLNCVFIGIGSLLLGHLILLLFGLAIPIIQVGGGIVICKAGYDMLSKSDASTVTSAQTEEKKPSMDDINIKLFYPLSFPLCLGPGAISVIFTLMATSSDGGDLFSSVVNYGIIALAILILLILLYFFLLQGTRLFKKLGNSVSMVISKFIAFITFCIGIQIIVTGIAKIFHLTIL